MSALLWATVVVTICTAIAVLVIAIVGTIDDSKRRRAVTWIIMWTLLNSGIISLTLIRIHFNLEARDDVAQVQIDPRDAT